MFTGIIEELGEVLAWERSGDAARITVRAPLATSDAKHGDSISVEGVCLTVVDQGSDWFTADVMGVTIGMSTLGDVAAGDRVNIERAAALGDRIGGHIVQGHIDGTSTVLSVEPGASDEPWRVLRFSLDREHAPLVARKGSIAVDGVSLTVSAVGADWFEVSLIPETLAATTLGTLVAGDRVNIETDILARLVLRMQEFSTFAPTNEVSTRPSAYSTSKETS
ncbi:MAG: riboflavin synthase [Pseudolysinimonas sp.]